MKKNLTAALPFLIMPVFIFPYQILDSLILVDFFGCGCVPSVQTNMLNIPYNANDLRLTVFAALTIGLSVWSVFIAKGFRGTLTKWLYCFAVTMFNGVLAFWVTKTFMWA